MKKNKKQVIENHFRKAVLALEDPHCIDKIQVNVDAHTSTSGDFLIQNSQYDIIVECKEVSCDNERVTKPNFVLKRFTQEYKMNQWQNRLKRNKGFLFLVFWHGRKSLSSAFMIPINTWIMRKPKITKSFITEHECNSLFGDCLENDWDFKIFSEVIQWK